MTHSTSATTTGALSSRLGIDAIRRKARIFTLSGLLPVLDAMPVMALVLSDSLQTVAANGRMRDMLKLPGAEAILGCRPGEALGCVSALAGEDGCATGAACAWCGGRRAMLEEGDTPPEGRDYRVTVLADGAPTPLDLKIWVKRIELGGERFTLLSLLDVSHEKRLRAMERIFFHDVLGSASGIRGLLSFLCRDLPPRLQADCEVITQAFEQHIDQIQSQKDLTAAESGELCVRSGVVDVESLLAEAAALTRGFSEGREVEVASPACRITLICDPVLLRRVLVNMLKNAVEAIRRGETVRIDCADEGETVLFRVHNPGAMTPQARALVFTRSFSTKGADRGLGTWSMKLLGERYLGGQIFFTSSEIEGTSFFLRLPKRHGGAL